jgi:putative peptide zinc metalloprotease protein
LELQARDAANVYVGVKGGILEEVFVQPGQTVKQGDVLAQLRNIDLDISIANLHGQREILAAQLAGLKRTSARDPRASVEIGGLTEQLEWIGETIANQEQDRERLRLTAPQDGTVLPPPRVPEQQRDEAELPDWSGSPMDAENLGATLTETTRFCQIGDPHRLEARLAIDQGDVEFVQPGQQVKIMMAQSAGYVYVSTLERVATEDMKVTPTHLSSQNGGELPTQMTAGGIARPLSPVFEAVVPLPENDPHGLLRIGLVGRAKIRTEPRTIAERLWRYVSRTFNFDL